MRRSRGGLRVAIIGLGQIGGSLGMALVGGRLAARVIGIDRDARVRRRALARRACHEATADPAAVRGCAVVVLAVPVRAILALAPRLAPLLAPGAVLTDTGSTKAAVARVFRRIPGAVPGHPMCGTERAGIAAADPALFRGAPWVLCAASSRLGALVRAVGARPVRMSPRAHDTAAALVSHVPYLFALALSRRAGPRPPLAAGGFRSATRVAAQPYEMGLDLLLTNARPVAAAARALAADLRRAADDLAAGRTGRVAALVRAGRRPR